MSTTCLHSLYLTSENPLILVTSSIIETQSSICVDTRPTHSSHVGLCWFWGEPQINTHHKTNTLQHSISVLIIVQRRSVRLSRHWLSVIIKDTMSQIVPSQVYFYGNKIKSINYLASVGSMLIQTVIFRFCWLSVCLWFGPSLSCLLPSLSLAPLPSNWPDENNWIPKITHLHYGLVNV